MHTDTTGKRKYKSMGGIPERMESGKGTIPDSLLTTTLMTVAGAAGGSDADDDDDDGVASAVAVLVVAVTDDVSAAEEEGLLVAVFWRWRPGRRWRTETDGGHYLAEERSQESV